MLKVIEIGVLEVEPEPEATPPAAGGLPLWQIGDGCSWPVSRDSERLLFCGQRKIGRRSYCQAHALIAYEPERRRRDVERDAGRLSLLAARKAAQLSYFPCLASSPSLKEIGECQVDYLYGGQPSGMSAKRGMSVKTSY